MATFGKILKVLAVISALITLLILAFIAKDWGTSDPNTKLGIGIAILFVLPPAVLATLLFTLIGKSLHPEPFLPSPWKLFGRLAPQKARKPGLFLAGLGLIVFGIGYLAYMLNPSLHDFATLRVGDRTASAVEADYVGQFLYYYVLPVVLLGGAAIAAGTALLLWRRRKLQDDRRAEYAD